MPEGIIGEAAGTFSELSGNPCPKVRMDVVTNDLAILQTRQSEMPQMSPEGRKTLDAIYHGLCIYSVSTIIVFVGVFTGRSFLEPGIHPLRPAAADFVGSFAAWDGYWYKQIAEVGYSYDPATQSSVAFFPGYPLLGRAIKKATGVRTEWALLAVSHFFLALSFGLLAAYVQQREAEVGTKLARHVLLAFGLFPVTCFFRMAYSESLFFFIILLALYGMQRKWPLLLLALVIGAATAVRTVGVALFVPFLVHLWRCSVSRKQFLLQATLLLPVATWGLATYMIFQYWEFQDCLAFVKTQTHWRHRPVVSSSEKLESLLCLEPIWEVFSPSSPLYWRQLDHTTPILFSLTLANPLFFLLAAGLTWLGARNRWLTLEEILLAAFLLLIPYAGRGYEWGMDSAGRFSAVVFPIYMVLGRLLQRIPTLGLATCLLVSSFYLGLYSALFTTWHRVL